MKAINLLLCLSILIPMGCKKDKAEPEEELPVLGTCQAAASTGKGKLTYSTPYKSFVYTTAGGGKIAINQDAIEITHRDYEGFRIQFWGETDGKNAGNHESLNGKHIKDRFGNVRSLIFPDGTKITMNSTGIQDPITSISIYEGNTFSHINLTCNTIEYAATVSEALIRAIDSREPDGETGGFEFTPNGLILFNSYTEFENNTREEQRVDLGSLNRDNPKQVNDLYDDRRFGHT